MAEDAIGRPVNANDLSALRAALLSSVQQVTTAQNTNSSQLDKLNNNLNVLTNNQFQSELKKLNQYVKTIADNCKGLKELKGSAKNYGAKSGKTLDFVKKLNETLQKKLEPTLDKSTDKIASLSSKLVEASKILGGGFRDSLGLVVKDLRTATKSVKEFFGFFSGGWPAAMKKANEVFGGISKSIGDFINWAALGGNKVSEIFSGFFDVFTEMGSQLGGAAMSGLKALAKATAIGPFIEMLGALGKATAAGVWNGLKLAADPFIAMGKFFGGGAAKYLGPIFTAFGKLGSVFKSPKVGKDVAAAAESLGTGAIEGAGKAVKGKGKGKGKRGTASTMDLCKCICDCLKTYLEEMVKLQSQDKKDSRSWWQKLFGGGKKDSNYQEWSKDQIRRNFKGIGAAISDTIYSEKPVDKLISDMTEGLSKAAGKIVEVPLSFFGAVIGSQTGAALGGLTEGIVNLVLKPLGEEINYLHEASQAMFATTGLGRGTGREGARTAPGGVGADWVVAIRRLDDYDKGLDNSNKLISQFGISMRDIEETGQRVSVLERTKLKYFKRGIQDISTSNSLMKSGLKTANLLGTDATETADMFADWNQHLGATTSQISTMALGLRDVARSTGLTGEHLTKVAKSSDAFLKNMRLAGTFTSTAANNVFGLMARAEKTGTLESTQGLLGVLQQSILGQGGNEQSKLLALVASGGNANILNRLRGGTLLEDRDAMKGLAEGIERAMMQFTGGRAINQLSREQRGLISNQLREVFGVGLEEMNILQKNLREQARGFAERLEELNKASERTLNRQQKQTQIDDLLFRTGAEILDKFDQALEKSGGNINAALNDIAMNEKDLAPLLKNLGGAAGGIEGITEILNKQADIVNKRLREAGITDRGNAEDIVNEAMAALRAGDTKEFGRVVNQLKEMESAATEQARRNADPVSKIQTSVAKIEALMRLSVMGGLIEIMPLLDSLLDKFEKAPWGNAKEMGKFIEELGPDAKKALEQLKNAGIGTPLQKLLVGGNAGFAELLPTGLVGKLVGEALPKIKDFITESLKEVNWEDVGKWMGRGLSAALQFAIAGPLALLVAGVDQLIKNWDSVATGINSILREFKEYKDFFLFNFALPIMKAIQKWTPVEVGGAIQKVEELKGRKLAETTEGRLRGIYMNGAPVDTLEQFNKITQTMARSPWAAATYKPLADAANKKELEEAYQSILKDFVAMRGAAKTEAEIKDAEAYIRELVRLKIARELSLPEEKPVTPMLPGMGNPADEAKKKAMDKKAADDRQSLSNMEDGIQEEAKNSKEMVALLRAAVKLLGGKRGMSGVDGNDSPYFDGPLDTEWNGGLPIGVQTT